LAPVSLFLILPVNLLIVWQHDSWVRFDFYTVALYVQILCYLLATVGWYLENKKLRFKILFVPYYFLFINSSSLRGIIRYFKGNQSAAWEKSKRAAQ
jgi:hypothetical protein